MMRLIVGILVLLFAGCATTHPATPAAPGPGVSGPWRHGADCERHESAWARFGCRSMAVLGIAAEAYTSIDWYSLPTPK